MYFWIHVDFTLCTDDLSPSTKILFYFGWNILFLLLNTFLKKTYIFNHYKFSMLQKFNNEFNCNTIKRKKKLRNNAFVDQIFPVEYILEKVST